MPTITEIQDPKFIYCQKGDYHTRCAFFNKIQDPKWKRKPFYRCLNTTCAECEKTFLQSQIRKQLNKPKNKKREYKEIQ